MSGRKYHHPDEQFGFDIFPQRSGRRTMREKNYLLKNTFWNRKRSTECGRRDGGFDVFGNVILLTPKEHHARILSVWKPVMTRMKRLHSGRRSCRTSAVWSSKCWESTARKPKRLSVISGKSPGKRSSASHCRNRSCGADALQDDTGGYSGDWLLSA